MLLDESFENSINENLTKIEEKYNFVLEHCFSVNEIIKIDDIRNLFFNLFSERLFTDIIICIIEYKNNCYHYKFIEQWAQFKVMLNHLKIDNIPNSNTKEIECKLSTVISDDKLDEIKSLAEEINEMVKNGIDFNTISKEKLKFDLFDELYNNIITKELSPIYEKCFSFLNVKQIKDNELSIQERAIEKIMSHYYIKNKMFTSKNFIDLKREINAMNSSIQK